MGNVTNKGYYGRNGELVLNGDTHFGVTSCTITPTYQEEIVLDISGDAQAFQGKPTHRLALEFHQDHITDGSISRIARELDGTVVAFSYTPDDGGTVATGNVRMKASVFGGGTGRHVGTLDLGVIGQPTYTDPA